MRFDGAFNKEERTGAGATMAWNEKGAVAAAVKRFGARTAEESELFAAEVAINLALLLEAQLHYLGVSMGMAKGDSIFIRLVFAAGTGFFYVKCKNPRKMTEKLEFRKYDQWVNCLTLFTEAKMKSKVIFWSLEE
ncbi:hypothetical protein IFM89_014088 [Coptis chinensis]|uniref:Large ribosomal subunit protein bL33c n=1 Tax=Coptis chinensis TaxID=261450 RepID=A0A835LIJ8_9MAGN|nr:hypothetical protein IFM89_014088 [Coptis chinensis]